MYSIKKRRTPCELSGVVPGRDNAMNQHTLPRATNNSPIARRRIAAGLTQTQLAERLGVTQLTVSRWENEGRIPRRPMLYKLAEMLACELRDLL